MPEHLNIVFVGQGPNQACWKRGLKLGRKLGVDSPTQFAEKRAARLAVTGAIGTRIGNMLGLSVGTFSVTYARRNLNARWHGKSGKGDRFDRAEGKETAQAIMAEGFTHFVLLGAEVTRCFGYQFDERAAPVERHDRDTNRRFLIMPHPSGIVTWWNDPFNRFRAALAVQKFVRGG